MAKRLKLQAIPETDIPMPSSTALRSANRRLRKCIGVLERYGAIRLDRNWPVSDLEEVVKWLESVQKVKRLSEIKSKKLADKETLQ